MIDRRELLARARERRLPLAMVEKDYVLGWALYGLTQIRELVFKGGTALAKVYFPEAWRLSEDLDFVAPRPMWEDLAARADEALAQVSRRSGLDVGVRSRHSNPGYLQLKVRYRGPLGRNWLKIDVTPEPPIDRVRRRQLTRVYSDYPDFQVMVESLEEIFAQKLRALVERKKVRDYYDVWRMLELPVDRARTARLFKEKLRVKSIRWEGLGSVFLTDLDEVLAGYWERELGRLVFPVPEMGVVLGELKRSLRWVERDTA